MRRPAAVIAAVDCVYPCLCLRLCLRLCLWAGPVSASVLKLLLFFWCNNTIFVSFFSFLQDVTKIKGCHMPPNNVDAAVRYTLSPPGSTSALRLLLLLKTAAAAKHRQPFTVIPFIVAASCFYFHKLSIILYVYPLAAALQY